MDGDSFQEDDDKIKKNNQEKTSDKDHTIIQVILPQNSIWLKELI